eukprot:scaffold17398_cov28-Attheya_sp.AAC.1
MVLDFVTVAASNRASVGAAVKTASTLVSERLFQNDIRLYANFVDQLDCNADSTDTNLLDLDDLDIFLEETIL